MNKTRHESSPVLAAMREAGVPLTLDNYLSFNLAPDDPLDPEFLETLPEMFHDEFHLRMEYDKKFDGRTKRLNLYQQMMQEE